jgi:hypothetical protein
MALLGRSLKNWSLVPGQFLLGKKPVQIVFLLRVKIVPENGFLQGFFVFLALANLFTRPLQGIPNFFIFWHDGGHHFSSLQ